MALQAHIGDSTGEREEFGRLTFRVKVTCPACEAVCEVEARGFLATKPAATIARAFMVKHDHTTRWTLP